MHHRLLWQITLSFACLVGLRRDDVFCLRWDQVELDTALSAPCYPLKRKRSDDLSVGGVGGDVTEGYVIIDVVRLRAPCKNHRLTFYGRWGRCLMLKPRLWQSRDNGRNAVCVNEVGHE